MRFVDTWLTKWMSGRDISTLYQSTKQTLQMWISAISNGKDWDVPVDQSKFDHKVTKAMVMIMLEEHKLLIQDFCIDNKELLLAMDAIIFALDGGTAVWRDEHNQMHEFAVSSGILSGWQWTAHFDTLANAAEYDVAITLVKEYMPIAAKTRNFQGDDQLMRFATLREAVAYVCALRSFGFEIHVDKTFFSQHHNEYLRRYATNSTVNGYPARMITNLCWLYPGQAFLKDPVERMRAIVGSWRKLEERLQMQRNTLDDMVKRDLRGAKIPDAFVSSYLNSPELLGGDKRGVDHNKHYMPKVVPVEEGNGYRVMGKGYADFRERFGTYQDRDMEAWFLKTVIKADPSNTVIMMEEKVCKDPLKFVLAPAVVEPRTPLRQGFPPNVVFGGSNLFMHYAYPDVSSFIQLGRAPKSWIYDYLRGRVKSTVPFMPGLSVEMASLVWSIYEPSMVSAMYHKKTVPDKWERLNTYAYVSATQLRDAHIPAGVTMY